jgi:uncharacterized membrane protein YcaP (DUF421 family)
MASLSYVALILLLRVSGKRTLTKMNAFDLVVTVALGSTLATVVLSPDVALAEGVLALAMLIGMQLAITWLSVRSATLKHVVKSEPSLLFHDGRMLSRALRAQRVTEDEVRAAMRAEGVRRVEDVEAVILETDGSFTVLGRGPAEATSAARDVAGFSRTAPVTDRAA